jgi:cell division protein FtsX
MTKSTTITIIVTAIILGVSFIIVQNNKAYSIEKQQQVELAQKKLEQNQKECEDILTGLKKQWSNIISTRYNSFYNECEVTYMDTETNTIETAPLSLMVTVK